MPRRVSKNVFDITRPDSDAPSAPPLGALLARTADGPVVLAPARAPVVPSPARAVPDEPAPEGVAVTPAVAPAPQQAERPARGVGGRPEKAKAPVGITAVAVRVPSALYAEASPLVKGPGRPSWGQLVAWTCQDHPAAVREQIEALAGEAAAPRRLRGHGQQGAPAVQVTARLLPEELAVVDEARRVSADLQVTRTLVLIAAITVATESSHPE